MKSNDRARTKDRVKKSVNVKKKHNENNIQRVKKKSIKTDLRMLFS